MRSLPPVLVVLMLAAATPVSAQERTWPEGSAMHTGQREVRRREAALAALSWLDRRLVALVAGTEVPGMPGSSDGRLVAALKAQQAAWQGYIKDECEVIGALTGAGGSWPSTYAVRCEANLAELRVRRSRAAIRCVERIAPANRWYNQNACLYQLAPLAVPLRP